MHRRSPSRTLRGVGAAPGLATQSHRATSGALNVARIRWGKRIFQKRGSLNLAFRPAKPGLIAQQGCHLRWPLETFRCVRDRMSYSFIYSFIANAGDAPPMSRLGTRRAYDQSYAAIKNWGQYELVSSPSDADLVFEVSLVGQFEQYGNTLRLASRCSRPRSWSGNGSQHSAARAADPRR